MRQAFQIKRTLATVSPSHCLAQRKIKVLNPRQFFQVSFCCDSRHVWLSLDPVRLPYENPINTVEGAKHSAPRSIRFSKPGKYEFFVTTQRVFNRDQEMTTYSGMGYAVTSENALSVEIVP